MAVSPVGWWKYRAAEASLEGPQAPADSPHGPPQPGPGEPQRGTPSPRGALFPCCHLHMAAPSAGSPTGGRGGCCLETQGEQAEEPSVHFPSAPGAPGPAARAAASREMPSSELLPCPAQLMEGDEGTTHIWWQCRGFLINRRVCIWRQSSAEKKSLSHLPVKGCAAVSMWPQPVSPSLGSKRYRISFPFPSLLGLMCSTSHSSAVVAAPRRRFQREQNPKSV